MTGAEPRMEDEMLPKLPRGLRWACIGVYNQDYQAEQAANIAARDRDLEGEHGAIAAQWGPAPIIVGCCVLAVGEGLKPAPLQGPAVTWGGRPLINHDGSLWGVVEAWRPSTFASEAKVTIHGSLGPVVIERATDEFGLTERDVVQVRPHTPRAVVEGARDALVDAGFSHAEVGRLAAGEAVRPRSADLRPSHRAAWRGGEVVILT